jgi:hypothetical protein
VRQLCRFGVTAKSSRRRRSGAVPWAIVALACVPVPLAACGDDEGHTSTRRARSVQLPGAASRAAAPETAASETAVLAANFTDNYLAAYDADYNRRIDRSERSIGHGEGDRRCPWYEHLDGTKLFAHIDGQGGRRDGKVTSEELQRFVPSFDEQRKGIFSASEMSRMLATIKKLEVRIVCTDGRRRRLEPAG